MRDFDFRRHRFVVIDFKALTPSGRPHEPIEVAAIHARLQWSRAPGRGGPVRRAHPAPGNVPVAGFDTEQTGLARAALRAGRPAAVVMADLDSRLATPPYRLVAHHASTEANLIAGQRAHCPRLAAIPLLDTVAMARLAYLELATHRLNALLWLLKIPHPPDRHRALADAEVTVTVFDRMTGDGAAFGCWSTLRDLDHKAGRPPAATRPGPSRAANGGK